MTTSDTTTDPDLHPTYMTVPVVAGQLRVSAATVHRLVRAGVLSAERFGTVLTDARSVVADHVTAADTGGHP